MQAIHFFHPWVFQHPGLNHGPGSTKHFLRRLEEKHGCAGDVRTPGSEDFGEGDGYSRVPVMPAGVHHARRP